MCPSSYYSRYRLYCSRLTRYYLLHRSLNLGLRLANNLLSLLASRYLRSSKVLVDCNRVVVLYRQCTSVNSLRFAASLADANRSPSASRF
jgi:hypothetical protein